MQNFSVEAEQRGERLCVSLTGEFDISNAGRLLKATSTYNFRDLAQIDLDLTSLRFVDSTGLRDFVLLRRQADTAKVPLTMYVEKDSNVSRVMRLVGFFELSRVVELPGGVNNT